MKKLILLTMAALMSAMSFAQESNDNVMKIYTSDGIMTPIASKEIKDITFEEITPLSMDIEISNVEQNSMDIDFPMPEGCKYWLLCVTKEKLTGTDKEIRMAIKAKYNDEFDEAKFLRIPNLDAGTTYYFYALMFEKDGVPAGVSMASATTKQEATDQFAISVTDITKNSATVNITPKDNSMTYYYFVVSEEVRQQMISQYGGIQKSDLEYLKYCAERNDYDLDYYLSQVLVKGPISKDARDIVQTNLSPNTVYYAYCYGMDKDAKFTTDVYAEKFTTKNVEASNNVLTCEIVNTYNDGCDIKVTASNNDPYIVDAQPKAVWEKKLANNGGDAVKTANDILNVSYSGNADYYTKVGNFEGKVGVGSADTEYVLIICGYDAGVTTDVQTFTFKTLAE